MSVTNIRLPGAAVPLFLAAQFLVVYGVGAGEHPPLPPPIATFPTAFSQWKLLSSEPIDDATAKELGADRLVSQSYVEPATSSSASLLVAWFGTQREGARQPHSPKVCLPGAGWTARTSDQVTVDTSLGAITVNRYVVDKDAQRAVVLYWYQTPRRVIASEWAAKFWLAADALRDHRTDTALVRVIAWSADGRDEAATGVATGFVRNLYPALRDYLPR